MASKRTHMGLGMAALAALGAYFLYGTEGGEERRQKLQKWVFKMKDEVIDRLSRITDVTKEKYTDIVDEVTDKYRHLRGVDMDELRDLTQELKGYWEKIQEHIEDEAKKELKRLRKK